MGSLLNPVITIGPIVLGLGLIAAIVCITLYLTTPGPKKDASLARFVVLCLVVGVTSLVAGAVIGIAAFCSDPGSGNLCGLGGIFGAGPFVSGICIGWYAYTWLKATVARSKNPVADKELIQ
jgi:hypothetical protein